MRRSTRRSASCCSRRAEQGLRAAWPSPRRTRTPCSSASRARVSPRIVEAPAQLDPIRRELDEYFDGRRHEFELPLDWTLVGPFGRRVLGATAEIPYGGVLTYTEVATEAGSPRGSRAAGNALGANPIPIVVPCHRVLRSGGALGGYGGGLQRKQFLLELEGALSHETPSAGDYAAHSGAGVKPPVRTK